MNHLAYANDTTIFASTQYDSLKKVMAVSGSYEKILGHLINKSKSSYYIHANVANVLFNAVRDVTGFSKGEFPFTYLGCRIFCTKRMMDYYDDLIKKVKSVLHS